MKNLFIFFGTFVFCCTVPTQAGFGFCGDYAIFVKSLQKTYQETSRGKGVSGGGYLVIELFTSAKGTWTILTTQTNGKTCITNAGEGWIDSKPEPIGEKL